MTPPIVVPAPTFQHRPGLIDIDTTAVYAQHLADSWVPRVLVAGPMGRGEHCTPGERIANLGVWLQHLSPDRLIAACWTAADTDTARTFGVQPLIMLHASTDDELHSQLHAAPEDAWVYANPRYSTQLLAPALVAEHAISGVKLSKTTLTELRHMRDANPGSTIVHGSSRDIAGSLAAGADLVTAPPLAALANDLPRPNLTAIQQRNDEVQQELDTLPDHDTRVQVITAKAARLTG